MKTIVSIIEAVGLTVALLYFYQVVFTVLPFIMKHKPHKPEDTSHKIGILIAARNESAVITHLIDSIHKQDYPAENLRIFVVADNCTDDTAEIARSKGAFVYERKSKHHIGKGYALNYLLKHINADFENDPCDAYIVLDADNVLEPNYVSAMNRTFTDGFEIITSYRNSKNYGDTWISAGYGLWFLRESKYINNSRMLARTSCAIGGTGFLVSKNVIDSYNGWNFFLLTEDIQFTVQNVIDGRKIGYCPDAVLYDEQPSTIKQSWTQRLRWSKGFLQVCGKYTGSLIKSIFSRKFTSSADMFLTVFPSIITIAAFFIIIAGLIVLIAIGADMLLLFMWVLKNLALGYGWMFLMGLITTITEWNHIHCKKYKKILYMFTFPIFLATYVPITIHAFFKKVKWEPIIHTKTSTVDDIRSLADSSDDEDEFDTIQN